MRRLSMFLPPTLALALAGLPLGRHVVSRDVGVHCTLPARIRVPPAFTSPVAPRRPRHRHCRGHLRRRHQTWRRRRLASRAAAIWGR